MSEKYPADDPAARVQRDNDFGTEGVERASDDGTLGPIGVRQISAVDQVRVQLKPSDESVAIAVFEFFSFRQTTNSGREPILLLLTRPGKDSNAGNTSRVR